MQEIFGSVRRSIAFRSPEGHESGGEGTPADKIGSCLRKSRVGFLSSKSPNPSLPQPSIPRDSVTPPIRWRRGELIGCGAFGRVYMGMNLDSGELLAVKQVFLSLSTSLPLYVQFQFLRLWFSLFSLSLLPPPAALF